MTIDLKIWIIKKPKTAYKRIRVRLYLKMIYFYSQLYTIKLIKQKIGRCSVFLHDTNTSHVLVSLGRRSFQSPSPYSCSLQQLDRINPPKFMSALESVCSTCASHKTLPQLKIKMGQNRSKTGCDIPHSHTLPNHCGI